MKPAPPPLSCHSTYPIARPLLEVPPPKKQKYIPSIVHSPMTPPFLPPMNPPFLAPMTFAFLPSQSLSPVHLQASESVASAHTHTRTRARARHTHTHTHTHTHSSHPRVSSATGPWPRTRGGAPRERVPGPGVYRRVAVSIRLFCLSIFSAPSSRARLLVRLLVPVFSAPCPHRSRLPRHARRVSTSSVYLGAMPSACSSASSRMSSVCSSVGSRRHVFGVLFLSRRGLLAISAGASSSASSRIRVLGVVRLPHPVSVVRTVAPGLSRHGATMHAWGSSWRGGQRGVGVTLAWGSRSPPHPLAPCLLRPRRRLHPGSVSSQRHRDLHSS